MIKRIKRLIKTIKNILKLNKLERLKTKRISDELYPAIQTNDICKVKTLLEKKVDINFRRKDNLNCTVLHETILKDHIEIVELLIAAGVNINAKNSGGELSLYLAEELNK